MGPWAPGPDSAGQEDLKVKFRLPVASTAALQNRKGRLLWARSGRGDEQARRRGLGEPWAPGHGRRRAVIRFQNRRGSHTCALPTGPEQCRGRRGSRGQGPPNTPPGGSAFGFGAQGGQVVSPAPRPWGESTAWDQELSCTSVCLPPLFLLSPHPSRWRTLWNVDRILYSPLVTAPQVAPRAPGLGPTRQQGSSQPWPFPPAAVTCVCTSHHPCQPPSDPAAGTANGHTRLAPTTLHRAQRCSRDCAPAPG